MGGEHHEERKHQVWWYVSVIPAIPASWRWRQEDPEFEANLDHIARPCTKIKEVREGQQNTQFKLVYSLLTYIKTQVKELSLSWSRSLNNVLRTLLSFCSAFGFVCSSQVLHCGLQWFSSTCPSRPKSSVCSH
jgi:hypothetical protein